MINKIKIVFALMLISISLIGQETNDENNSLLSSGISETINQQVASLRGTVIDDRKNGLQGASVLIIGTEKGVNTNENGQFYFGDLEPGEVGIQVSIMGYKTQNISVTIEPGFNEMNFTLEDNIIHLKPVTVNAQKRAQQILDVPTAINVVGSDLIEQANIVELGHFSDYIPGLNIIEQGANRPTFVIRGLTSEEVSPSAQPRVSVYQNNVPINRANGASVALYDMERVEVLRGPQNALFGRSAQIGAIHFISKRPGNTIGGYASVAFGNYNQREFRGAINLPIVKDKLFVRAAGFYDFRDGFVENTFGGTLNGKNTRAGRLSVRYLPAKNHQLDLILSYQNDDTPGIAFMSKQYPNTEGDTDIFNHQASLEQGDNLYTGKELFDAALYYKYAINEHTYLSTITSFRKTSSGSRWDGDGTAAPALDFRDDAGADQFYQEVRYNFSWRSRLNGSAGLSYWYEKADQTYWFSPNEQSTAVLFFQPDLLILPNGQPLLIPALPDNPELGPLAGLPLPEYHLENNYSLAKNQALEAFIDATYQITRKLYFTGGIRAAYENFKLSNEAAFVDGEPSTLGLITGNHPNMFFRPTSEQSM
ncbi:MAG: TonB-dependent receptor, partial [Cyclobacteriaceae bacterium]